mmetsp:Transcript_14157/g.32874  ORF Transcript_14157/g.32874 Transcript_14157/m.32874 type:complete len:210 (-) Transcript_14157:1330-1959(-)
MVVPGTTTVIITTDRMPPLAAKQNPMVHIMVLLPLATAIIKSKTATTTQLTTFGSMLATATSITATPFLLLHSQVQTKNRKTESVTTTKILQSLGTTARLPQAAARVLGIPIAAKKRPRRTSGRIRIRSPRQERAACTTTAWTIRNKQWRSAPVVFRVAVGFGRPPAPMYESARAFMAAAAAAATTTDIWVRAPSEVTTSRSARQTLSR